MGKPLFDVPESIEDVLRFSTADASNLSLVDKEGLVIGFYANQDGLTHISGNGFFEFSGATNFCFLPKAGLRQTPTYMVFFWIRLLEET